MNRRVRQQMRAMMQRKYPPVLAVLHDDTKYSTVLLIDPRELEEYKARYGDRLEVVC